MAKQAKNKTNVIIGVCAAIIAVILIIVAIVFATNNSRLDDSYFVSDGTKYVITMEEDVTADTEEYSPAKTHLVYKYSGDTITDFKAYYEYLDNESAQAAYEYFNTNAGDSYKNIELVGKYVILTPNESEYEGLTLTEVKQQGELIEMLNNLDLESEAAGEAEVIEVDAADGETVTVEESTTEE